MKNSRKIGVAFVVAAVALLAGIYAALWHFLPDPWARGLIFGGVLLLAALGVLWAKFVGREVNAFSDSVCELIDQMGREKAPPVLNLGDDGPDMHIKESLGRFYTLMHSKHLENQQAKQEIQEIISDISHQVKTPVANVKIYTNILRGHDLPEQQRQEFLSLMDGQVEKLDFLMQSMIKMSRLETGVVTLTVSQAPVCHTVVQAMNGVLMKAEDKQIELSADCPPELTARHDPKWTAEAIGNILDNAVKYTPEGGSVFVSVRAWQFYVRIDITDTGMGIPEEHYHDIFKRFYRMEEVAQNEGVGIGLYLAREIITLQKGYISVKSEVGKGTTFSVYLLS